MERAWNWEEHVWQADCGTHKFAAHSCKPLKVTDAISRWTLPHSFFHFLC